MISGGLWQPEKNKAPEKRLLAAGAGLLIRYRRSGPGHKQKTGSLMGVTKEEAHQGTSAERCW